MWLSFIAIVVHLESAFPRKKTFHWAILVIMSFIIRTDMAGASSFIRSSWILPSFYTRLTAFFHSSAIKIDVLTLAWSSLCIKIFAKNTFMLNGRFVLMVDGIKIPKEGRKMPGVKVHYQDSQNNKKSEYIMGHFFQSISLLISAAGSFCAVPLASRIHEGFKLTNRDHRTLFDKLFELLKKIYPNNKFYLLGDAYYACHKVIKGLLASGNHLVTRVKHNAVAYECYKAPTATSKKPGRPKLYDKKIRLSDHFKKGVEGFQRILSPVYDEKNIEIEIKAIDLLKKGISTVVRYVLVKHPRRGNIILMTTDTALDPIDVVRLYGKRFKIEVSFKEAIHTIGAYTYRFWMKSMRKIRKGDGTAHLHKKDDAYRAKYLTKINAYHVYVQLGLIAQGIMQYIAVNHSSSVWEQFRGWLRTIRPGIPPSERTVSQSMRNSFLEFLLSNEMPADFKKFLEKRIDPSCFDEVRMTG